MDTSKMTQKELLQHAMTALNMTRSELATEIETSQKSLDNWMLDPATKSYRQMPGVAKKLVRIILLCNEKNYCISLNEGV